MMRRWLRYGLALLLVGAGFNGEVWPKDFRIAVDIGHSGASPGAISARGAPEYLFNRTIGVALYGKLRQDKRFKGSFLLTRPGADLSLPARADMANRLGADLLLSIHHDSVEPEDLSYWVYEGNIMSHCDKFTGYSIFYSEKNGHPIQSLIFAVILGSEMLHKGFCPTLHHAKKFTGGDKDLIDRVRGIYKYNNLVVLKSTKMPAVLFECGIIKNRNEELQLSDPKYQQKLVAVIFTAIEKYFGLTTKEKLP